MVLRSRFKMKVKETRGEGRYGPTLGTLMWVPVPGTVGPINHPATSVTQFQCYKT